MKLKGGYTPTLKGRPSATIHEMPESAVLYFPLKTPRFAFSTLCVDDGAQVNQGAVLAIDPKNYSVPLLASRAGTVRLNAIPGHLVLENSTLQSSESDDPIDLPHAPRNIDSAGKKRYKLLKLGAWQFVSDVKSGSVPDPFGRPQAVIISTMRLEPFLARGDVQLRDQLTSFTRGLEHLQSLLEYEPIHLVFPKIHSAFAEKVRDTVRGYAWIKLFDVSTKYPFDDFRMLARRLGIASVAPANTVWGLRTEGVLAFDRALTSSKSCCSRVIAVGGPAVNKPAHVSVISGYPLPAILEQAGAGPDVRIVNGGALTGTALDPLQHGLDTECLGLTVLSTCVSREFLGFVRPGFSRRSYCPSFASAVRPRFSELATVALQGEKRACVACGFCATVCPARLMPAAMHKLIFQGQLEQAEQHRPDLASRRKLLHMKRVDSIIPIW